MKKTNRYAVLFCSAMLACAATAQSATVDRTLNAAPGATPLAKLEASTYPQVAITPAFVNKSSFKTIPFAAVSRADAVNDRWPGKKDVTIKTVGKEVDKGMKFDIGSAGVDKVSLGAGTVLLKPEGLGVASPPMAAAANFWNIDSRSTIGAANHPGTPPQQRKIDTTGSRLAKTSVDIMPVSLIGKVGGADKYLADNDGGRKATIPTLWQPVFQT